MRLVAVDVGGTHVRFTIAALVQGKRPQLGAVHRYRTADHPDLASAWRRFAIDADEALPDAAAIGVAAPIGEPVLRFVNSPWTIDTRTIAKALGVGRIALLNDFGAMAHAVSVLTADEFVAVQGETPLRSSGVVSVMGPGTGLGVAILLRRKGRVEVIETESSHIGFAPLDEEDVRIAEHLHRRFGRVSIERLVSGPGLIDITNALAPPGSGPGERSDAASLWSAAIDGSDPLAAHALDRLVLAFGSAAGDFALAHGAAAVVIIGGLACRIAERLKGPLFLERFRNKGRYRGRMEAMPVLLALHEEPGLLGAAVAFQREHARKEARCGRADS